MLESLQGKSAAQNFWLKLMNVKIQKRFLQMKEKQQCFCLQLPSFDEYYACVQRSKKQMDEYVLAMQFYQHKFETCIDQGVRRAHYKEKNVYNICSRKMTEHMRKVKL